MTIWGTGSPLRQFIYSRDLAKLTVLLVLSCSSPVTVTIPLPDRIPLPVPLPVPLPLADHIPVHNLPMFHDLIASSIALFLIFDCDVRMIMLHNSLFLLTGFDYH